MNGPTPGEEIEHLGETYVAVDSPNNRCTGCSLNKFTDDRCIRKDGAMYCSYAIWVSRTDLTIRRLTS